MENRVIKGFTLIELLVVIAIIGILSGIVIIGMSGATNAANDSRRKFDIDQIRKALVMKKVSSGLYPIQTTPCNIGSNCANLSSALVPEYFAVFPRDPNGTYYNYYSADGTIYTLTANLSSGVYGNNPAGYGVTCLSILVAGKSTGDGIYTINPTGTSPFQAYCDMTNDGGGWTLVFNQATSAGYFTNSTDAMSKNSNNPSADLYSILDKLELFRSGDKITLKINWPDLGTGRNIWSQTINPVINSGISPTRPVAGYIPITIDYTGNYWGGLEQQGSSTFLDGSVMSSNWFYAIGSYAAWSGGIPAYSGVSTHVQLWAK